MIVLFHFVQGAKPNPGILAFSFGVCPIGFGALNLGKKRNELQQNETA